MKKVALRYRYENLLLVISVISTVLILYFLYNFNYLVTIIAVLVALFYIRLYQGQYLGNSLQVSDKHFYRLKQVIEEKSNTLNVPEPKLFITQDPYPNAYTIGFKHPYSIVLSSSLVEDLTEEELDAVISHELGHVKFHHARISSIISPAGKDILVLTWIFGFWQRATELTADRISLSITETPRELITSLIKISVGTKFLSQIDEEALLGQSKEIQKSLFNKWGEYLNNHPYLTTRIRNILDLSKKLELPYYKGGKMFCVNCGKEVAVSAKFCPECGFNFKEMKGQK